MTMSEETKPKSKLEIIGEHVGALATKSVGLVVSLATLYVLWDLHEKLSVIATQLLANIGCQ